MLNLLNFEEFVMESDIEEAVEEREILVHGFGLSEGNLNSILNLLFKEVDVKSALEMLIDFFSSSEEIPDSDEELAKETLAASCY